MSATTFFVPLAEYEKRLIDNFVHVFDWKKAVEGTDITTTVLRYKWTRILKACLEEVNQHKGWIAYHHGDWSIVCECLERSMEMDMQEDRIRFRSILAANSHLSRAQFDSKIEFSVDWSADDSPYWKILATLLHLYDSSEPAIVEPRPYPPVELPTFSNQLNDQNLIAEHSEDTPSATSSYQPADGGSENMSHEEWLYQLWDFHSSRRDFEVWSLLRACASILRRGKDSTTMVDEAVKRTDFYETHDPVHNGFIQNGKSRDGSKPRKLNVQVTSLGYQVFSFGDHPLKYLEFVPWSQLQPVILSKPTESFQKRKLLLWNTPKLLNWEKHLFTEDGIFGTCVLSGYEFPDYLFEGKIVFARSPIKDFTLFSYMGYWREWNDCVVTHDPETDEWHLLETLPGLHFRSLSKQVDEKAAIMFFRKLVQHHVQGREESLSSVLGEHFQPKYENLLNLIPFSQISEINSIPVGEGERGVVFRAVWSHKSGFGDDRLVHHDVVLKSIKIRGSSDIPTFMKELDSTFSAVSGAATSSLVQLHGITQTPSGDALRSLPLSLQSLPANHFLLVLDFAKHGGLKEYLLNTLNGTIQDWPILVRLMVNIVNGLQRIHARKLKHRDIHWKNVLVSTRRVSGETGPVEELVQALISDLGEGQHFSSQSQGRTYYGNEAFWAPEVRRKKQHTEASDIWAVGCLFLGMVQLHWDLVQPEVPGSTTRQIQRWLLEIILSCLEYNADDRVTARDLAYELDAFEERTPDSDHEDSEVETDEGGEDEDEDNEDGNDDDDDDDDDVNDDEARSFISIEPENLQKMLAERNTSPQNCTEEDDDIVV